MSTGCQIIKKGAFQGKAVCNVIALTVNDRLREKEETFKRGGERKFSPGPLKRQCTTCSFVSGEADLFQYAHGILGHLETRDFFWSASKETQTGKVL